MYINATITECFRTQNADFVALYTVYKNSTRIIIRFVVGPFQNDIYHFTSPAQLDVFYFSFRLLKRARLSHKTIKTSRGLRTTDIRFPDAAHASTSGPRAASRRPFILHVTVIDTYSSRMIVIKGFHTLRVRILEFWAIKTSLSFIAYKQL